MPDDRVEIKIIADAGGVQSGMRDASSAVQSASAQINTSLRSVIEQATGVSSATKSAADSAKAFAGAFGESGGQLSNAEKAMRELFKTVEGGHTSISRITLDTRELFDEFTAGRDKQMLGTFARLLQQGFGLGPAMLAGVAGVAALAGGLAYLTYRGMAAAEALRQVQGAAAFHNVALGADQIEAMTKQLEKLPGSSAAVASEVMGSFLAMKDANGPLIQALVDQVGLYADAMGDKLPEGGKKLAASFDELSTKGAETLRSLGASRDTIAAFENAVSKGDVAKEYEIALTALSAATGRYQNVTHDATKEQEDALASLSALTGAETGATRNAQELTKAIDSVREAQIKKSAADIAGAVPATAAKVGPTGPTLDTVKEHIAQIEATWTGAHASLLREEVKSWQDRIAVGDLYGKTLTEAQNELARAQVALVRETSTESVAAARESASEIAADGRLTAAQRLGFEADTWGKLLAGDKLTSAERVEVQRTLNQTLAELNRQRLEDAKRAANEEVQSGEAWVRGMVKAYDEETALAKKASDATAKAWDGAFGEIDGAAKTFLGDVISRHETVAEAGKAAIQKLVSSWITGIAEIMIKITAFEALEKLSGIGGPIGGIAGSGASALGTSLTASLGPSLARMLGTGGGSQMPNSASDPGAQSVEQLAQLVNIGNQQLSTGTDMLSGVTQSGGTLIGMATTAASGFGNLVESAAEQLVELILLVTKPSVLGTTYAAGTAFVPSDQVALLHRGEMVIPADISAQMRSPSTMTVMGTSAGNVGSGGAAATGVSGNGAGGHTINFNISAIDGPGVAAFFNRNGTTIARTVANVSGANPSITAPAY